MPEFVELNDFLNSERFLRLDASKEKPVRTSSVLVVVILICTFPIWIGLAGTLFGLVFGLIGGLFGLIGGIFGAIFGLIGAIFGGIFHILFGWTNWGWHGFPHHHFNGFGLAVFIIIVALLIRSRQKAK